MVQYAKVAETRENGNPRPRLTVFGYTVRAGSPTNQQVKLEGEKIWRRVYVVCFSNCGTTFVRVKGEMQVVV